MNIEEAIDKVKGDFYKCPKGCKDGCFECLKKATKQVVEALEDYMSRDLTGGEECQTQ